MGPYLASRVSIIAGSYVGHIIHSNQITLDKVRNIVPISTTVERVIRDLGRRIARIRLSRNLTQASLSHEADTSVRSIKWLEAGERMSLWTH